MPDDLDSRKSPYPIELNLAGRQVVVVGGGAVAERKAGALVDAGALVRIVSPDVSSGLQTRGGLTLVRGHYEPGVLNGAALAFACTDDPGVNARVAADAKVRGIWCNVADSPELSDFLVPATLRRGRFGISVGTGGAAPLLAASVRDKLASQFGPEYGILAEELARARAVVQEQVADPQIRRDIFKTLCEDCSLKLLAARDRDAWNRWFERVLKKKARSQRVQRSKAEEAEARGAG